MILFPWEKKTLSESTTPKYDVLIFSVFGRNHWLASQLKSVGLSVALMDLTALYQKGLAEDWEGPLPLIFPDSMARSYSQSLVDQDRSELLNRGPSLRVKGKGLLEFKSDHAGYVLDSWQQSGLWLTEEDQKPDANQTDKAIKKKINELEFKNTWLKALLKQWRSNTLKSLRDVDQNSPEFPLNANYVLRQPSRRGYMESSSWLKDTGVVVLPTPSWWRLNLETGGKWSLSLKGASETTESLGPTLRADKFILGLTSYELHKFSGQFNIPEFELKTPTAFWVRWRGKVSRPESLDFIPSYSMYLSNPEFGVFSENMITVIKRPNGDLDIWACLSIESLSDPNFQDSIKETMEKKLQSFVPEFEGLELEDLRLGSDLFSFWPLYKYKSTSVHQKLNLITDSPETWLALDTHSRYLGQLKLIEELKNDFALLSAGAKKK